MGADDAVQPESRSPLIAVPNVSEGRDEGLIARMRHGAETTGAKVLDVHRDPIHNRSVFTLAGSDTDLLEAVTGLAMAATAVDLTTHSGVHPRLGVLDVCPFVIEEGNASRAVAAARAAARSIGERVGLPVFLYGDAARRRDTVALPRLREGGLTELGRKIRAGLIPDEGPSDIDPSRGVVCVGARRPLIAFNVWLRCSGEMARAIAGRVRTRGGGPPGVRALGWSLEGGAAQISMNLITPYETGIDDAFDFVAARAREENVDIIGAEIVGLPPERFLPDGKREAARLLMQPGRSLESALLRRED